MRTLTFILGAILTAYCSAGVLSETAWQNNEKADSALCLVFLCNNAPLVWRGRDLVGAGKEENIQRAIATFRKVLQRDPQDPYRWADLGEALLKAGQKEDARYCYDQVLTLAPRTGVFLLRVANFHFQIGENKEALRIAAQILALIPDYDSVIFGEYTHFVDRTNDILQFGLPEDRRAAKSWLEFLLQAGRVDDAQRTWDWIAERGYADDALAGDYVEFLIRQGHPDLASSTWTQYLGARANGYGKSNHLFNGDFGAEPARSPFDWTIGQAEGVEVTRDSNAAGSGKSSLRIHFAGSANLNFAAASQLSFMQPGRYRFHALIRTESVTTDQGIRFRISDSEVPARLDQVFGQFTGNNTWSEIEQDLVVAPETRLIQIQVIRQPSLKFDNKIGGVAWIGDLKLEPIALHSPQ